MSEHRLGRWNKFIWFVIVGMILTHTGYYFKYVSLVSGKSSVSDRRQEKTTDNQMYNQSVTLYSAFINEEYSASAKIHPLVRRQITVLSWQTENVVEETFKCCILQGKNHVMASKSTRSHQCCYNMGLLRARRIECPLVGEFSKLTGVSLAKWNMSCPTDKLYYITPTVLDPVLKKNKWAVCNKYFYGPGPNARLLVEWFEIHRFVGVDKFTIHYESTINSTTKKVLQFYQKKGLAEVLHIDAPFKDKIKRHSHYPRYVLFNDEQIGLWDCRERHKYYEFSADIDSDEFILPKVIKENATKNILTETFRKNPVGAVTFYTHIHMTSWEPTNATHPLFIGQYEISTEPLIEAPKNMYMPSRMNSGEGTIHTVNPAQGFTRIFLDPGKAAIHHFRPCRSSWLEPFLARIFRNGTVTEVKLTCSTFSRVLPIVMQGQYVEQIGKMVQRVYSRLGI
ncbi:uncharacterized protein LOC128547235 [Mercenaria mercenaria]|uniref:uncharacterized protein LOC128547235 n=1 Tax=Mercenaria mercenaria TaxID=6596 RepID=UPI00234EE954|nr:uncharacterized protein LOC128547235 [Mercenaria mercenaria]